MLQEVVRSAVGHGAARRTPAASELHPSGLQQHVECAFRRRDPANFLDFCPGDGLVVGNDRQGLQSRARQAPLRDGLTFQEVGQVVCRSEGPLPGHTDEIDATPPVEALQLLQERPNVLIGPKVQRELLLFEGLLGREQKGLDNAQLLPPISRRQRHHVGRQRQHRRISALLIPVCRHFGYPFRLLCRHLRPRAFYYHRLFRLQVRHIRGISPHRFQNLVELQEHRFALPKGLREIRKAVQDLRERRPPRLRRGRPGDVPLDPSGLRWRQFGLRHSVPSRDFEFRRR